MVITKVVGRIARGLSKAVKAVSTCFALLQHVPQRLCPHGTTVTHDLSGPRQCRHVTADSIASDAVWDG